VQSTVASVIESVVNLAKRRGLVYPAGEIYGGTRSAWDYGPLGVELKENIKRQWWRSNTRSRRSGYQSPWRIHAPK
jgi:glycyl-tRNA synthetase